MVLLYMWVACTVKEPPTQQRTIYVLLWSSEFENRELDHISMLWQGLFIDPIVSDFRHYNFLRQLLSKMSCFGAC